MKRKNYNVTIKIKFETSMLHSQTSAYKAQEEVERVYTDILKEDKIIKSLFDLPPHIVCNVKIDNGKKY